MSQIKQLLLLHQQGKGKKTIAGMLGISRTTVKTYLGKLDALTGIVYSERSSQTGRPRPGR